MQRPRWLRIFCKAISAAADHERRAKEMYERGFEFGRMEKATIYAAHCERHAVKLIEIAPGTFVCTFCQERAIREIERQTGPIITERPLFAYLREQHQNIGSETERYRAVKWKGK